MDRSYLYSDDPLKVIACLRQNVSSNGRSPCNTGRDSVFHIGYGGACKGNLLKYIYEHPGVFIEAMRDNTFIGKVYIDTDVWRRVIARDEWEVDNDNDGDEEDEETGTAFGRLCTTVGRALNGLRSLTKLHFEIRVTDGVAMATILNHIHDAGCMRITSCSVQISFSELNAFYLSPDGLAVNLLDSEADRALRRLKSMEELDVRLDKHDSLSINNPFPESLGALPNLRSINFSTSRRPQAVNVGPTNITNFLNRFASMSLRELEVSFITVDNQLSMALTDIVAQNAHLESLVLLYCYIVGGENTVALFNEIGRLASLRKLDCCPSDIQTYHALTNALKKSNGLRDVHIRATHIPQQQREVHFAGLHLVVYGMKMSSAPIVTLKLVGYELDDLLGEGLRSYLTTTASLKLLELSSCIVSEASWCLICSGVAECSSSLTELYILNLITNASSFRQGISLLAKNLTLETLFVDFHETCTSVNTFDLLLEAIPKFGNDTSLKKLYSSQPPSIDVTRGEQLLEVLQQNYTLTNCPFAIPNPYLSVGECPYKSEDAYHIQEDARIILKLNHHGRNYLLDGKKKDRGVNLLASVSYDLDSIFYHLSKENPSLCCRDVRNASRGEIDKTSP